MKYEIEAILTEYPDVDTVCLRISDKDVKKIFEDNGQLIKDFTEDGTLSEGEIQIYFPKDSDQVSEVLVFPVYKDYFEQDFFLQNGDDFIRVDQFFEDKVMIQDALEKLQEVREKEDMER